MSKSNASSDFAAWLAAVPLPARRTLDRDDDQAAFDRWRASAPQALSQDEPELQSEEEVESPERWIIVEIPQGEVPVVRVFKSLPALVRCFGRACGDEGYRDSFIYCFRGVPLPFSGGDTRYLMLPDGETAVSIPRKGIGPLVTTAQDIFVGLLNEDGYVGDPSWDRSGPAVVPMPHCGKPAQNMTPVDGADDSTHLFDGIDKPVPPSDDEPDADGSPIIP